MIQKVAHFAAITDTEDDYGKLFAVLEDGAVYYYSLGVDNPCWNVLPPIPETIAAVRDEEI